MDYLIAVVGGYLLGSIPFGLLLTRAAGLGDIRAVGSGNIGATNVLRTGRKDVALATLALDAAKAAAALALARAFLSPEAGFVAGAAALIGHCFPVWLRFNGGKGVATFFGTLLVGAWPVGVGAALVWLATAFIFRFSSLGALVASGLAAPLALVAGAGPWAAGSAAVMAVVIWIRHKDNLRRLIAGEEPKIGASKAKPADTPDQAPADDLPA